MSGKSSDDRIYLIDNRVGFVGRYVVTYGTLFGLIGVGVMTDSAAMQWVGGLLAMLGIIGIAHTYTKQQYKTPQEAADYIAKKYGVMARERR